MQVYLVGGAVRDQLLGRSNSDRDYVVVGSSPEAMLALGYQAVGRDFPVFLHPKTHEEYALARTERKTGPGYHGFAMYAAPEVTLEQDLARRDLTINAMAMDAQGQLYDPYHGAEDLRAGLLRHVSPAFVEDPVRILRLARFAARFDFAVAPETMQLLQHMVQAGEVDALVAERVWQEWARGLMEPHPQRMWQVLHECGALARLLPAWAEHWVLQPAWGQLQALAVQQGLSMEQRWALLWVPAPGEPGPVAALALVQQRYRVPVAAAELARLACTCLPELLCASAPTPAQVAGWLQSVDCLRRPERWQALLGLLPVLARAHGLSSVVPVALWQRWSAAYAAVDAGAVAAQHAHDASQIRAAVAAARECALQLAMAAA